MRVLMVHNFYQNPGGEDRIVREELAMLERTGWKSICLPQPTTTSEESKEKLQQLFEWSTALALDALSRKS